MEVAGHGFQRLVQVDILRKEEQGVEWRERVWGRHQQIWTMRERLVKENNKKRGRCSWKLKGAGLRGAFFVYKKLKEKWFGNGLGGYQRHHTHCLRLMSEHLPFEKHRGSHVLGVEPQLLGGRNSEHIWTDRGVWCLWRGSNKRSQWRVLVSGEGWDGAQSGTRNTEL